MKAEEVLTPDLVLKLYSGIEVLKTQQVEINRRLTSIEAKLAAQDEEDSGWNWRHTFWQAVIWSIGITLTVAVGKSLGVQVAW